jgi:hypothetical protein
MAVVRALVLVLAGVALAGCGDDPAKPSRGTFETRPAPPLRLCGMGTARVVYVSGRDALDAWRAARARTAKTGLWPVLLGSDEDAASLRETLRRNCRDGADPRRELAKARDFDIRHYAARRRSELGLRKRQFAAERPLPPSSEPKDGFTIDEDILSGKPLPRVSLALLPTREGWQAPVLLEFGGWNDNPPAAVHGAIQRDWSRRFGAEVVAVSGDVIETRVTRPPQTETEAIALAGEQYVYAPDIVQQGTDTVRALAAILHDGRSWYFWWD